MAIIQQIRNRAGILVSIFIGMALLAFILGDFLTSGGMYFKKQRSYVALVNGEGVSFESFQKSINDLEEITKMQNDASTLNEQQTEEVRQRTWDEVVENLVMDREYDKLGLTVNNDELYDLIGGERPHPYIQQFFADPKTGIINNAALHQFLSQMNQVDADNPNKKLWLYIEDLIYNDRKLTKYRTLLKKGLYATTVDAKRRKNDYNKTVDFSYILKRYSEVSDTSASISDKELKAYYNKHKEQFKQKQSRDIRYIIWEVVPSEADYKEAQTWINDVSGELKTVDQSNAWQYIKANSDVAPNVQNFTPGELPSKIDSFAFKSNVGDVYGPYFENDQYKLAKLIKIVYLPDSVKASHILLRANQNNVEQVKLAADSLLKLALSGVSFEMLARQNSSDGSAEKGGDLGWFKEGQMVKPFNDTCFMGKKGDIKIVYSQFGVHIVKIVEQSRPVKKVEVGILAHAVHPSEATDQYYYSLASNFGGKNTTKEKFNNALRVEKGLDVHTATGLNSFDQAIPDVDRSREIVRWAYEAKEGDVTPKVYQFDNKYVFAILDKAREDGYSELKDVRNTVLFEVRKEKIAEKLSAQMHEAKKAAGSLPAIGTKLGAEVKTATNVRFTSFSIPGLGNEPKLVAAATYSAQSVLSEPIEGTNGVYIIQVDRINSAPNSEVSSLDKSFVERGFSTKLYTGITPVLNEMAKLKDNRINFY